MSNTLDIIDDPANKAYELLIDFARLSSDSFTLVIRTGNRTNTSCENILEKLAPCLIEKHETDEWPGTKLIGHTATLLRYRMDSFSANILKTHAQSLFSWQQPERPEDLAFYNNEGQCWLGSIAHENDAFIYAQYVDLANLLDKVPELKTSQ